MSFALAPSALHEVYAARHGDGAALGGLALGLAGQSGAAMPIVWVRQEMCAREAGGLYPPGLVDYGIALSRLIHVRARDALAALQAGLEVARTPGPLVALVELWGETSAYDLTASRRLALAAQTSGALVVILRQAATSRPSAAETRWSLRALPSRALAAHAPGPPAFEATLLRARNGQEGLCHHLEWNRDEHRFVICDPAAGRQRADPVRRLAGPPLSGAVVPVSFDRPGAPRPAAQRRTG